MKTLRLRQGGARWAVLPVLALMLAYLCSWGARPAHALSNYPEAQNADTALRYVGQLGGNACAAAGLGSNPGGFNGGDCKQFANCILRMASNGTVITGGGYYSDYGQAGGTAVT